SARGASMNAAPQPEGRRRPLGPLPWLAVAAVSLLTRPAPGAAPPVVGPWLPPRLIGSIRAGGALAFSPARRTLTAGALHPRDDLLLWEVACLRVRSALPVGRGLHDRFEASFTRDGRGLVTCAFGKRIRFWDLSSRKARADLPWEPHAGPF